MRFVYQFQARMSKIVKLVRFDMFKVIRPGQLVTYNNVVYRCNYVKRAGSRCTDCDLKENCCLTPFYCCLHCNFKRIQIGKSKKSD